MGSREKKQFAKIDANQPDIVDALKRIPGVAVEVGHDDILVGYDGMTKWYEIKQEKLRSKKTGECIPSALKPDQKRRLKTWPGHYKVVFCVEDILADMNIDPAKLEKNRGKIHWGFPSGKIPDKFDE